MLALVRDNTDNGLKLDEHVMHAIASTYTLLTTWYKFMNVLEFVYELELRLTLLVYPRCVYIFPFGTCECPLAAIPTPTKDAQHKSERCP